MGTSDLLTNVLGFVGPDSYLYVGGISRFQYNYFEEQCICKKTSMSKVGQAQSMIDSLQPAERMCCRFMTKCIRSSLMKGDLSSVLRLEAHCLSNNIRLLWKRFDSMATAALKSKSLECLLWCRRNGYKIDAEAFTMACGISSVEIVKWFIGVRESLTRNGQKINRYVPGRYQFLEAAAFGRIEILKLLKQSATTEDNKFPPVTISRAARNGHMDTVKFLIEEGTDLESSACCFAALGGHLEILKYLRSLNCPWDSRVCWMATLKGSLATLKWARDNGCPWDDWVTFLSFTGKRPEIFQYAVENGCPQRLA